MASAVDDRGVGDPGRALGMVASHLRRHPEDHAAWAVAAEALVRLDRPEEAVEAARRAQRPHAPERLALLAWALAAAGLAHEARSWLSELGADVGAWVAWERAARAHERLGETSAALAAHGRAVELAPGELGLAIRFADRVDRAGDPQRALGIVRDVLASRPDWAPARRLLVRLLARRGELEAAAVEARTLLEPTGDFAGATGELTRSLMLELARIEARREDPAAAMRWAAQGNQQALADWRGGGGDPDALWSQLDALAKLPVAPAASGARRAAPRNRRVAFVVGFPQSGVDVVRQMLDAHPVVRTLGAAPLVERVLDEVFPGVPLDAAARAAADTVVAERIEAAWWKLAVQRTGGLHDPSALLIDAIPLNVLRLDLLVRVFPEAPVVLVVRDPRDAVLSSFLEEFRLDPMTVQLTDLVRAARLYDRSMKAWLRAAPKHGTVLRYESLVEEPLATWRPLVEELGMLWDSRVAPPSAPLHGHGIGVHWAFAGWLSQARPFLEPWVRHFGYEATP